MSEKQRTARRAEEAVRKVSPWVEQFALVGSFLMVGRATVQAGQGEAWMTRFKRSFGPGSSA